MTEEDRRGRSVDSTPSRLQQGWCELVNLPLTDGQLITDAAQRFADEYRELHGDDLRTDPWYHDMPWWLVRHETTQADGPTLVRAVHAGVWDTADGRFFYAMPNAFAHSDTAITQEAHREEVMQGTHKRNWDEVKQLVATNRDQGVAAIKEILSAAFQSAQGLTI